MMIGIVTNETTLHIVTGGERKDDTRNDERTWTNTDDIWNDRVTTTTDDTRIIVGEMFGEISVGNRRGNTVESRTQTRSSYN